MKKFNLIVVLTMLISLSTFAQQKFGYTNLDQIIALLPEIKTLETQLQSFKKDSIDALLPYLVGEYTKKDSLYKKEKNDALKQRIGKELDELQQQLNNWQAYAQNRMQVKQQELLAPLYQKAGVAIRKIATEHNYTYIFNYNALVYAPPADDVSLIILKELGVDVTELEKQAAAAAANSNVANNPPANPKTKKK